MIILILGIVLQVLVGLYFLIFIEFVNLVNFGNFTIFISKNIGINFLVFSLIGILILIFYKKLKKFENLILLAVGLVGIISFYGLFFGISCLIEFLSKFKKKR